MDCLFALRFPPQTVGAALRYRLRVRDNEKAAPRDVDGAAISESERQRMLPTPASAWAFKVEADTATLTLPTFSFWRSDFKPQYPATEISEHDESDAFGPRARRKPQQCPEALRGFATRPSDRRRAFVFRNLRGGVLGLPGTHIHRASRRALSHHRPARQRWR